jgi:hypothetical protein
MQGKTREERHRESPIAPEEETGDQPGSRGQHQLPPVIDADRDAERNKGQSG